MLLAGDSTDLLPESDTAITSPSKSTLNETSIGAALSSQEGEQAVGAALDTSTVGSVSAAVAAVPGALHDANGDVSELAKPQSEPEKCDESKDQACTTGSSQSADSIRQDAPGDGRVTTAGPTPDAASHIPPSKAPSPPGSGSAPEPAPAAAPLASSSSAAPASQQQRLEVAAAAVLVHAAGCKSATCPVPHCNKMRKIHMHFLECR